jgi:hypothetical protein
VLCKTDKDIHHLGLKVVHFAIRVSYGSPERFHFPGADPEFMREIRRHFARAKLFLSSLFIANPSNCRHRGKPQFFHAKKEVFAQDFVAAVPENYCHYHR